MQADDRDELQEDPGWYPEGWRSKPGHKRQFPGIRVVLEGGPLHGRTGHLSDPRWSLWVARVPSREELVVKGSVAAPHVPEGGRVLGRYTFSEADEALRWSEGAD